MQLEPVIAHTWARAAEHLVRTCLAQQPAPLEPSGSEPVSSHQRILIPSTARRDIRDPIIHLSYLNVSPMLGSLRFHHVIESLILQHVEDLSLAWHSWTNSQFRTEKQSDGFGFFISGGIASRCGQNCLCMRLDRHTANQRTKML